MPLADGREVVVIAHVMHEGEIRSGADGWRQSIDLVTEEIVADTTTQPVRANLRLAIYGKDTDQDADVS